MHLYTAHLKDSDLTEAATLSNKEWLRFSPSSLSSSSSELSSFLCTGNMRHQLMHMCEVTMTAMIDFCFGDFLGLDQTAAKTKTWYIHPFDGVMHGRYSLDNDWGFKSSLAIVGEKRIKVTSHQRALSILRLHFWGAIFPPVFPTRSLNVTLCKRDYCWVWWNKCLCVCLPAVCNHTVQKGKQQHRHSNI